jgi:hypothetical protein
MRDEWNAGYEKGRDDYCCNGNCNQGRDCPLRTKTLTDAEIGELIGQYSHYENWEGFARAILRKAQEK